MTPTFSLSFALPAEPLQPYITTYYLVKIAPTGGHIIEDYLHPEWANIRLCLAGGWDRPVPSRAGQDHLFGPTTKAGKIETTGATLLGIGLLPRGWARFIEEPASELANQVASLPADLQAALAGLFKEPDLSIDTYKARIDQVLSAAAPCCSAEDEALVARAHQALMEPGVTDVDALAQAMGVGPRQMSRISLRAFGFTPKVLLRRQRFLRTLDHMRANLDTPWSQLIDDGYTDQSHFIRDFKAFMGMTPSAYFKLPRHILDPAARLRSQVAGQGVQGLHAP